MVARVVIIVVIVLFLVIWIISPEKTNPQITSEIEISADAKTVMERSCYDCHSNKTSWPWYSYFPPGSFFVGNHVENGRSNMNFTEWDKYDSEKKLKLMDKIIEEIEEGKMPLESYLILHDDAKLSQDDIDLVKNWIFSKMEMDSTNVEDDENKSEEHEEVEEKYEHGQ